MNANRRHFIRSGALLAGAAAGLSGNVLAAPPAGPSPPDPLSTVTAFLRSAGVREIYLSGGSVLGARLTPSTVRLLAVSSSPQSIFSALLLRRQTLTGLYADGNTLSFYAGPSHFTVECLTSAALAARQARLASGKGIRFVHEALTRRLETGALVDPGGVLKPGGRTLRFASQPAGLEEQIAAFVQGSLEGPLYGLTPSAAFSAFGAALLAGRPATDAQAASVANEVTVGITLLARYAGPAQVTALLNSPLVSASLMRTYGVTGAAAVAAARQTGVSLSNGAPWLRGILGPQRLAIRQGSAWIAEPDRFTSLQSNAALSAARSLGQGSSAS